MSVDSISSSIQSHQYRPVHSARRAFETDGPAAGSPPASVTTDSSSAPTSASGSLQSLSSDLRNILLQLQSSSGSGTAEAGNPTQAVQGVRPRQPHHHGGRTQQATAPGGSQVGATQGGPVTTSAASAASVLSAG